MNKGSTSKTLDNLKWLLALIVFAAAVVGNSYFVEVAFLYRVLGVLFLFIIGLAIIAITSFGTNAIKLMRESRTEVRKVVWPTRMETTVRCEARRVPTGRVATASPASLTGLAKSKPARRTTTWPFRST